jgi:hypothetical protein
MARGAAGAVIAAPIWHSFMQNALADTPVESFQAPKPLPEDLKPILRGSVSGSEPIVVDSVTEKRIPASCVGDWPENYKRTVEVKDAHAILYYVQKDEPRGDPPPDPSGDPQFANWEAPVRDWATKNGYLAALPEEESCDLRSGNSAPNVTITAPKGSATVTEDSLSVTARLKGEFTLKSASAYLDGDLIQTAQIKGSQKTETVEFSADLSSLAAGFHTISVESTDVYDNVGSAQVRINVVRAGSPTVYFVSPEQNFSVGAEDFPLSVQAFASASGPVSRVSLIFQSGGKETTVSTALQPSGTDVMLVWKTAPAQSGKLSLQMTTGGTAYSSDFLTVTVE